MENVLLTEKLCKVCPNKRGILIKLCDGDVAILEKLI